MRNSISILLLIIIWPLVNFSQMFTPGSTYYDSTGYVEYRAGNLPIIISVPHGGIDEPSSIPDLSCDGTPSNLIDAYTKQIAEGMYNAFFNETGCYPHIIIINLLHKKKFNANRNLTNAACGNPIVKKAWYEYHDFIDSAKVQSIKDYGKGLFLDFHSHAHPNQRIELGYLLSKNELQLSNSSLDSSIYITESSIRNLVGNNIQNISHSNLLRGQYSFGTLMNNRGFPCVPSTSDPYPQNNEDYFSGGHNTIKHGSRDNNGEIDGIQMEFNQDIRFNNLTRDTLVDSLTATIIEYINYHYNNQFADSYCNLISSLDENKDFNYFKLYPNPATDILTIKGLNDLSNLKDIQISNIFGKSISAVINNKYSIDVSKFKNGIHFIHLIFENKTRTLKFIKN